MTAYNPQMMYHMHPGIHPGAVLGNIGGARFPPAGPNHPTMAPVAAAPASLTRPAPEVKPKVGPSWETTYRTAQNIAFPDSRAACGPVVGEFVEDLARGIGCPVEYVLVSLLPCVGGLLGTSTNIRVHRAWTEPPVVWSIVGAGPGSRRSAVIRQLLAPILTLQTGARKPATHTGTISSLSTSLPPAGESCGQSHSDEDGDRPTKKMRVNTECTKRALYSGTRITLAALTEVLHRNDGHAFSLTENVQNLHEVLGLTQPLVSQRLVSVLEDLYEGLPLVAVEDGRVTTIPGSSFCHGGFANPDYVVTLMVKSPPWLSARLLLACPQVDDMKGVFGEPCLSTGPELEQVYAVLLERHSGRGQYSYSLAAVQELSRFFEEEWSTVLNQLDQNEHEGIIGKAMGQIVRLSGILKALENSLLSARNLDGQEWDWTIEADTVKHAVVLGKYFLEQKLAMTFMVGTGFFSGSVENSNESGIDVGGSNSAVSTMVMPESFEHSFQSGSSSSSKSSITYNNQSPLGSSAGMPKSLSGSDMKQSFQQLNGGGPSFGLPRQQQQQQQPGGEVDFSTLPQTMTTAEEDVSEMMQAVDFVHFTKTQFVAVHGRRIKRLLECYDDGHGVSATTAAQKSITPPIKIEGTNNRHPAWASALFFQKVAELELGNAEQGRHPTNRKVCWRFKRKPVNQLSEKDFQLLQYLRVEMDKYSQFGSTSSFNANLMMNSGLLGLPPNSSPGPHSFNNVGSGGGRVTPGDSHYPGMDEDSGSPGSPLGSVPPHIKTEVF